MLSSIVEVTRQNLQSDGQQTRAVTPLQARIVKESDYSPMSALFMKIENKLMLNNSNLNRAYPENTNFETFVPRNLKFHTFGDLHTTKKYLIS